MSIGPLLGYIFITTVTISLTYGGAKANLAGLHLYEIVLIFMMAYSALMLALKAKRFNFIPLDFIVVAYVFFSLIPVVLSSENLYVAVRDYRHLLLVPLIAYLTLPFLFDDFQQIPNAFLFIIPVILISTLSLVPEFLRTGVRAGSNLITLGLLSSWSVGLPFIFKNISFTKFKPIAYFTSFLMLLILTASQSRAAIFGFLISLFMTFFIFTKKIYQKVFIFSFLSLLSILFLSLALINEDSLRPKIHFSDDYKQMRRSVHRLSSVEYYIDDIKDRMYLWQKAFNVGLESPIFGTGASSSIIFKKELNRGTSHNIFMSKFLTSGFFGLSLFILVIIVSYTAIFSFAKTEHLKLLCKFLFIALTVLLIVGATNDFSGGRSLLFFILLSGIVATKKLLIIND